MRSRGLLCSGLVTLALFIGCPRAHAAPEAPRASEDEHRTNDLPAHGPSSKSFPSHHFQWAPHSAHNFQAGVNFGIVQLVLGGFNVSAELRYRRLWLAYQHGFNLTVNNLRYVGLTRLGLNRDEREQNIHLFIPYSTGFGIGLTLLDELWLGTEFTASKMQVHQPGSQTVTYQTYSIGLVLGYRLFLWRGLHANAYLHYWPNVSSSLHNDRTTLRSSSGSVTHNAHSFGLYPNLSIGYAFDL